MTAALHAEWTKLHTLAETWWLAAGVIAVAVGASAAMVATTHISPGGRGAGPDPTRLALTGIDLAQAVVAIIGVVAVTEEYGTGMVRVSLAAIPRRELVLAAKALIVTGLAVAAALPSVAGCLTVGRLLLPSAGLDPAHGYALVSAGHAHTVRAGLDAVLYLVLIALLGVGIGALVRETAVATAGVLGLLYLPPLLALLLSGPWRRHIEHVAPMTAGLGVLGAWAVGAVAVGAVVLRVRDA